MLHTCAVAPEDPGAMCSMSPSILLFATSNEDTNEDSVLKLVCTNSFPRVTGGKKDGKKTVALVENGIGDMCCISHVEAGQVIQMIVVATVRYGRLRAYSCRTGDVEWQAKCILPGMDRRLMATSVTTDGSNRIFVYDGSNTAVHSFSPFGKYEKLIWRTKDKKCRHVRWHKKSSSLIVADSYGEMNIVQVDKERSFE